MDGVVHPNVEQAIGRDRIRKALKRYENRPADEHRYGIVRSVNEDGSYEVLLDGDVQTSRCAQYGTAFVGDRVLAVTKKDGRNDLLGRLGGTAVGHFENATVDGTLHLNNTTDAEITKDTSPALIIGDREGRHLAIDNNEIVAKASPTEAADCWLVGDDIWFHSAAANVDYLPYYKAGDSVSFEVSTAGFATSSASSVRFIVPLSKPIIGNPTVTVESVGGFILRQNGSYTHGSSSNVRVKPSSYEAAVRPWGVVVWASFSNTTNATNNDAIGVNCDIKITFS